MSLPRSLVFLLVLSVVLGGASLYVGRRAAETFGLGVRGRKIMVGVPLASIALMILSRVLGLREVGQVAFTVLLALLISAVLLGAVDLVQLGARWIERLVLRRTSSAVATSPAPVEPVLATAAASGVAEPIVAAAPPEAPKAPERRVFLGQVAAGSAMVVGSTSSLYGAVFGRHDYVIEEVPLVLPGLSKKLDGYTLVQLSDIHLGTFVGEPEMRAAEELVRKARPDRIVLTGDLIDSDPRYAEALGRLVRRLAPLARDGVTAIPGNHDHYAGIRQAVAALEGAGARVLRNDGLVIGDARDGIALLGVDDVWARRNDPSNAPDLDLAISKVPADLPRVLLCHNPVFFPEAAGKVALQISGHTHGGQVNLGALRPGKLVLPYGYIEGLYERAGSRLYVNRGFGTAGPPARVGAAPEVTRIVLSAS
ncbi:metallophosphoesterase [Polyangium aurulentum]|uniref:metallophosphoesterase n=1 Tax=Polyangium aurulentum TaxID=2567896 RepID=UPI0010ADC0D7|nr:metallophosphoesterase [Polyangium aurulentum]UQA59292.1 metallophosphoesterase [Polyangium aurulentum]